MISDNNNNNNNNNNFEYLFWKVIHNKYLFNLIFQKIEDIILEIKLKNPMISSRKFKDITSFCWMFGNGLFNLLICKLKNKESLRSGNSGISIILDFIFNGNFDLVLLEEAVYNNFNSDFTFIEDFQKTKDPMKLKLIKKSINEIFLTFKHNKNHYENLDVIAELIKFGFSNTEKALKLLQILVVDQNIFPLTPHHFSLVLINFDLQFIKRFIEIANKSKSIIIDEIFRNTSISLLLYENEIYYTHKNISVNQDVLEFILDNPEYHSQNYDPTFIPSENRFQYCRLPTMSYKRSHFQSHLGIKRERDIKYICDLRPNIQIKLMELKYFNTFEAIEYQSRIFSLYSEKEKYKVRNERDLTNKFLMNINNSDLDGLSKVKKVYSFLSKYSVCNSFKQSFI